MTRTRLNGCHNQPRPTAGMPLTVQAGWFDSVYSDTRYPKMVTVPFVMQADCQYTKTTPDKACDGCQWQKKDAIKGMASQPAPLTSLA